MKYYYLLKRNSFSGSEVVVAAQNKKLLTTSYSGLYKHMQNKMAHAQRMGWGSTTYYIGELTKEQVKEIMDGY